MARDADDAAVASDGLARSSTRAANDNAALPSPQALLRALDCGDVSVCYDPVIDLARGAVAGFEVSARWFHPLHGTIAGKTLTGLARAAGADARLPLAVLGRAARCVGRWPGYGFLILNIEASVLERPAFIDAVQAALRGACLAPERLMFAPVDQAISSGDPVPEALALCSLLRKVPASAQCSGALPSMLRLDHRFATDKPGPLADLQRKAAKLGRDAGLAVLGRGLDTEQHLRMARLAGCSHGQGRWLGLRSPLPVPLAVSSAHLNVTQNATANCSH